MKAKVSFRSTAGFTLIELTAALAVVAVLTGSILPAIQKLRTAAGDMRQSPALAELADAALAFDGAAMESAQSFLLGLGGGGAVAAPSGEAALSLDALASFCGAGDEVGALRAEVATRLARPRLPGAQRRMLASTASALEELLPAVQRMDALLASPGGPCS